MNSIVQNLIQTFTGLPAGNHRRTVLFPYPVLAMTGFLVMGFLLGEQWSIPHYSLVLFMLVSLLAAVVFFSKNVGFFLTMTIFWLSAGALLFGLVFEVPMLRLLPMNGKHLTLEGHLEWDGRRFFLRDIKGFPGYAPSLLVKPGRGADLATDGINVQLSGRFRLINSFANPGVTDLFDFWWKRRVFGEITAESLTVLEEQALMRTVLSGIHRFRERFFAGWEKDLGETYPLFAALVWGERGEAFDRYFEVLRKSGIYHAFSVSGLHMALFGGLVLLIFQGYAPVKKISWVSAIVFSFVYLIFCGFVPSAFRAWLMFALFLIGRQLGRSVAAINFLCLAFVIMLFLQPETVFHAGAQLSFTATGGILLVSDLAARLSAGGHGLFRYLKGSTTVSLGVFSTSLPVLILHGFSFSSLSFLGNLLLMPVIQITIGLTFLGTVLGVWQGLRMFILPLIRFFLSFSLGLATWFTDHIPYLYWDFTSRAKQWEGLYVWLLMIACLLVLYLRKRPGKLMVALVGVVVFFLLLVVFQPGPLFEFWVLDVGQGLGTAVLYGERAVVFDSGGIVRNYGNVGASVLSPFLRYQGIEAIEAIFITHPHQDHQAGTGPLMENYPVEMVFYRKNGAPLEARNVSPIEDPARFFFADRILVQVYPVDGPKVNDQALVFRIELPGLSVLVSGDIEEEGMRQLFRYGTHNIEADVLVMPHHGQYTPEVRELLLRSGSSFAIISVGENRYGHPDYRTLKLLHEMDITTFVTERDGGVRMVPKPDGWRIETFGKSGIRTVDQE
ncbi:MAG TPA: DNA internalization-related competence protein ComEC/Rec2 [Atribacteraceae bacterium]|nr:DNA internalization-related competence protein ComEC/Rec2 [Atribacteraceae bacterium]